MNLSTAINEINNKQNTNNYFDAIVILHDEFINLTNTIYNGFLLTNEYYIGIKFDNI